MRRTLTLPTMMLRNEGLLETVFTAGVYDFEAVTLELAMGTFQPDALVRHKGVDLAVEFFVRHAVDVEKLTKVRARNISMVEIDLSKVNAGLMEADEIDAAILHSAPRKWIHHRKTASAQKRLDIAIAAKRAERGRRLAGHIRRPQRRALPKEGLEAAMAAVRRAGLESCLGKAVNGGHWFTVPATVWQAEVLFRTVIEPSEIFSLGSGSLEVRGKFPAEDDLSSNLPDWMIRTDLSHYSPARLAEAGFNSSTYGYPHGAVWHFLSLLAGEDQAVFWSQENEHFCVEPTLRGRLYRRVDLQRIVMRLLSAAGVENCERAFDAWKKSFCVGAACAADVIEAGGEGYRGLVARLATLEGMLSSYVPTVVDDLCGLPLEAVRRRNEEAIAAKEAKRRADLDTAAAGRVENIRRQAEAMLGSDAPDWLAQTILDGGATFLEHAGQSDDALSGLERRLAADSEARQRRIVADQNQAERRIRLLDAAKRVFATVQLVDLFLNSSHPKLQGNRPIDFCRSEKELALVLLLLPKKR